MALYKSRIIIVIIIHRRCQCHR